MNRNEFLLMKLAEECAEVAQRALKQIHFGKDQVQVAGEVAGGLGPAPKEAGLTNSQRLLNELVDFVIIINLLEESGELPPSPTGYEFDELKTNKVEKMNKYLALARSKGLMLGDWTI